MEPVKIGILGLGVVGCGTVKTLQRNAKDITNRAGRAIEIKTAVIRDPAKNRDLTETDFTITTDPNTLFNDPEIQVVVELIGGDTQARDYCLQAINHGKHIVTANKALIANHGHELFSLAQENGVIVAFEAAVAGGIPIIKAIREGLAANRIHSVMGIINGTCNYILSEMRESGAEFAEVLASAQAQGFAEADPSFDINGIDVGHKLSILTAIAFGCRLQFEKIPITGIRNITLQDISYARELGYTIKHLGIAKRHDNGIECRVQPTLIPSHHTLAHVNGVMNAVLVESDPVGSTLYYGAGAGAEPTASAVVADLIDVVRTLTVDPDNRVPHLAFQPNALQNLSILGKDQTQSGFYCRLKAVDKPGVLADITKIFGDFAISIESILQKQSNEDSETVPIVILTHKVAESNMDAAIQQIEGIEDIHDKVMKIHLERLA